MACRDIPIKCLSLQAGRGRNTTGNTTHVLYRASISETGILEPTHSRNNLPSGNWGKAAFQELQSATLRACVVSNRDLGTKCSHRSHFLSSEETVACRSVAGSQHLAINLPIPLRCRLMPVEQSGSLIVDAEKYPDRGRHALDPGQIPCSGDQESAALLGQFSACLNLPHCERSRDDRLCGLWC
jgi:hypothetical protein